MISICGNQKSRGALRKIDVPVRDNVSDRWVGLQHGQLADTLEEVLNERDIGIKSEKWATSPNEQVLIGGLSLDLPKELKLPDLPGMDYALGVRHSNDGRHALSFLVGAQIFICSNGLASGEIVLNRKHTSGIDLRRQIYDGVEEYVVRAQRVVETVQKMKDMPISLMDANTILMEAGRDGLLPWSHIGKVDAEYRNPTFKEHDEKTGWGIYNAFTYVAQKSSAVRQLPALNGFREIVLAA